MRNTGLGREQTPYGERTATQIQKPSSQRVAEIAKTRVIDLTGAREGEIYRIKAETSNKSGL